MILLSFDIEEFDLTLESNQPMDFSRQMAISVEGTHKILSILDKHNIKATFFCTANFAVNAVDLIKEIKSKGHEIASHTYYHSQFEVSDLLKSKETLENIVGDKVIGLRMPRMQHISSKDIINAGYIYNSSLNPTLIPGRYNNLDMPRIPFIGSGVLQLPSSVTPKFRFPLFWLSFHNLPLWLYMRLAYWTYSHDNYFMIYFHPWEFIDLYSLRDYKLPYIVKHNSGDKYVSRLDKFIDFMKNKDVEFGTVKEYLTLNKYFKNK